MKKAKLNKIKEKEKTVNEANEYSISKLIKIIIVIAIVFGVFYLITTLVVKPDNTPEENSIVDIDYDKITVGQLLDRPENEYYVLATMKSLYANDSLGTSIKYNELYNDYISRYNELENHLNVYNIDLDDAINKEYISDDLNISDDLSSIKLNEEVLFKVKEGKIDQYYVGSSEIIDALSNLNN